MVLEESVFQSVGEGAQTATMDLIHRWFLVGIEGEFVATPIERSRQGQTGLLLDEMTPFRVVIDYEYLAWMHLDRHDDVSKHRLHNKVIKWIVHHEDTLVSVDRVLGGICCDGFEFCSNAVIQFKVI